MSGSGTLADAEDLVRCVARAFYSDPYVVLLDALLLESFIIDEELSPRLKIGKKEIQRITNHLELEMIIASESVPIDGHKAFLKCYYINYQTFVDSVRLRVHLMQREIQQQERTELKDVYFECPKCGNKYTSLEVQRLFSKDYKFICSSCSPGDCLRETMSEPEFTLREIDNTAKVNQLQSMGAKLDAALSQSSLHLGIYNLLAKLKNVTLPKNLPSSNLQKGIFTSQITDEKVASDVQYIMEKTMTYQFGTSIVKTTEGDESGKSAAERMKGGILEAVGGYTRNLKINIVKSDDDKGKGSSGAAGGKSKDAANGVTKKDSAAVQAAAGVKSGVSTISSGSNSGAAEGRPAAGAVSESGAPMPFIQANEELLRNRSTAFPHFLQNSGVFAAEKVLQEADVLRSQRHTSGSGTAELSAAPDGGSSGIADSNDSVTALAPADEDDFGDDDTQPLAKKSRIEGAGDPKGEEGETGNGEMGIENNNDEEVEDDVDWEDED